MLRSVTSLPRRLRAALAAYPPPIRLLFVTQSLVATANGALYPFLGLYVTARFGVGIIAAGLVSSSFFVSAAISSPVAGMLADRIGRRPIIVGTLAFDALFLALLGLAPTLPLVVLAVVGSGLTGSAMVPVIQADVSDVMPPERRSGVYGAMYQALGLGWFLGPVMAAPLLARFGYPGVFGVATVLLVVAGLLVWRRLPETLMRPGRGRPTFVDERGALAVAAPGEADGLRGLQEESGSDRPGGAVAPEPAGRGSVPAVDGGPAAWYLDRRLLLYVALHLCSFGAYVQLFNIFPIDARDRLGLSADAWAAILAVNGAMILFGQPIVSKLAARLHKPYAVAVGVLAWSVGFTLVGMIREPVLVLPAVVVLTLGEMTVFPIQPAVVAELAPPDARARYQGALSTGGSIGNAAAPTIGAVAVAWLGGGWWILLGALLVGLAWGYVAFGRRVFQRASLAPA